MAVNRAILEYANGFSKLEEPCLWYKPRSDFINLTKLIRLVLTKKKEEKKEEESKRESTVGSWVWETLKNIGEKICVSGKYKASIEGTRKKTDMKVHEEKYILRIKVKTTEIESTMDDLIPDLAKEECDWLEMDPKVVEN